MRHRTGPLGRALRLVVGMLAVLIAVQLIIRSSLQFLVGALAVFVALALFYAGVHYLVSTALRGINRWVGAAFANLPAILVYLLGIPGGLLLGSGEGQLAAVTYVGIALLIAGARADPGCEVMSIPGLVFGQQTHLACIAFSPIDWLEERLSGGH